MAETNISIHHNGKASGWEESDKTTHDATNEFPNAINLYRVKKLALHQPVFAWHKEAIANNSTVASDAFIGNRIWTLRKHIMLCSKFILWGNHKNQRFKQPEVYKGDVPYIPELFFGKAAPYFHKAIRLTGGQKEVNEILADPNALLLVTRSMLMQMCVELVIRVPFYGWPPRSAGDTEDAAKFTYRFQVKQILGKSGPSEIFRDTSRKVAFDILSTMKPIFDLATKFWVNRGANESMIYQFMYDITTSAGAISQVLRVSTEPFQIVMPGPGIPYNHEQYVNRPSSEEDVGSFPKYISEKILIKKADDEATIINVLSAQMPFVRRIKTGTVICHAEVVTYQTTLKDKYPQPYFDGTIHNNLGAWIMSLFTATMVRKALWFLFGVVAFVFIYGFTYLSLKPIVIAVFQFVCVFLIKAYQKIFSYNEDYKSF